MTNILVIDDDDQVRRLLGAILRRKGYAVAEADDGYAGIKHCRGNQVDLVITDILMPEHDGIELLLQIKKTVPHIKVVVISGAVESAEFNYLDVARRLGADRTVRKPFEPAEVLGAVQELLH